MAVHGTFTTATRTQLVGTWEFTGWRFRFWADGSRTYLTGWRMPHLDRLFLGMTGTVLVGRFTQHDTEADVQ